MHIYLNCVYFHFEMCFDFSRSLVLRNDKTLILHIQNMNLSPHMCIVCIWICLVAYMYRALCLFWYCIVYTHVPTLLSHIPRIKVNWTAATNMPQHTSIECLKSTASIIRRTPCDDGESVRWAHVLGWKKNVLRRKIGECMLLNCWSIEMNRFFIQIKPVFRAT